MEFFVFEDLCPENPGKTQTSATTRNPTRKRAQNENISPLVDSKKKSHLPEGLTKINSFVLGESLKGAPIGLGWDGDTSSSAP